MSADIRADQPGGAGSGVAGQARTGLWVGVPIELHDVGAGTPGTRTWSLVDRPEGSTAVVGAATSNPATFTGDVPGRYLVMLSRDGSVTDPSTNCMVRVFEVSLTGSGAAIGDYYPFPATGEQDHHSEGISGQGNSGRGYAPVFNTFRDAMVGRVASVQAAVAVGTAQTLPATNTTLTAARAIATATPAISPSTYLKTVTHTVPNGTSLGETKSLDRSATDRGRVRFVDASGRTILWANRPGATLAQWDGTTWRPMGAQRIHKVFRPEEFADPAYPNVGTGTDAEADTRAIERMRNAVHDGGTDYEPTTQPSFEFTCECVFEAPIYLLNRRIDWYGTDYSAVRVRGVVGGWTPGGTGTRLKWAGPTPAIMSTTTLTFNRAARTIVRATGSFITDGFSAALTAATAAGMDLLIYCDRLTGNNRRIFRVQSVTASTITVAAVRANPVVGFDTSAMLPADEVSQTGYAIVEALSMFRVAGVSGYEFTELVFQARSDATGLGQVWSYIHLDIEPDYEERTNSSNNRISRVSGVGLIDDTSAQGIMVGRPGCVPPIGSQCDTVYFDDLYLLGNAGVSYHKAAGIRFADGNNTKSFWVRNCAFSYFEYGIDHRYASEVLNVENCRFESCWGANVYNAGVLNMTSCQAERSGAAVRGPTGTTSMQACSWNLRNSDNVVVQQKVLVATASQFINYSIYLEVQSINTGTDTFTVANYGERVPVNGDVVVIRQMTLGEDGLPGNTNGDEPYFLDSVTPIGGVSYTCRLYRTAAAPGGSLVNLLTAGTAGVWLLAPVVFQTSEHNRAADDGASINLIGCRIWGADRRPFIATASPTVNGLVPTNLLYYNAFTRSRWLGCTGVNHTRSSMLPDTGTVPIGDASLAIQQAFPAFGTDCEILFTGVDGWTCIQFDFAKLKINASTIARFYLPYRSGIVRVVSEVVPDSNAVVGFAGTGLTALTAQVGIHNIALGSTPDPDNLLTAHPIHAAALVNARDRRWGFTSGQRGVDLQLGNEWWQYNTGSDLGWSAIATSFDVLFTPTGGALANLTAGRLRVYVKLERIPSWERS